jgi:DNA/RNA endonuclease YhcR with UshA esterase domain
MTRAGRRVRVRRSAAGQALLIAGIALLVSTTPTRAHHSFATQYDINKPVEMKGAVTKVEWTNPHARFYIDVKDEKGQVTNWNFEMASPNVLARNGWKPNTLKIGDQVTVGGYLARTAPRMAIAGAITDATGRPLFASTQADLGK